MGRYWVHHAEHAWLPASLVEGGEGAESLTFKADDDYGGEIIALPGKDWSNLAEVTPEQEAGVDDACSLPEVSEAALLHNVRMRYLRDITYTRVCRVLIALNPFRSMPIYSSQVMDRYMAASDSMELPPHIFCISKDALQGLKESGRNQAILISGESGAGKTESAKLILSFVTEAVRGGGIWDEEKVRQTNPVLEAFGNAMTVRNNNSSRFGKWLDLRFSGSHKLLGCCLTSYLLETTRVCSQAPEERGFHIFFQLLQARSSPEVAPLQLEGPRHYRYLRDAQLVAPGIDDAACFEELCEGLTAVGFTDAERVEIFRIVAGVLTLGNCDFKASGEDEAVVSDEAPLRRTAELLGIDKEVLLRCVCSRKIVIVKETTVKPLNKEEAQSARDALARLIYGQLFLWLIRRMNSTLSADQASKTDLASGSSLLGVLDIAGFESFKNNSLEQLLINLSNEHLQQHFNNNIFKMELADCAAEGVPAPSDLGFVDNSECLVLIDGRGGVLDLLEETLAVPKATNGSYAAKVHKQQAEHPRFIASKFSSLNFGIRHFAGNVTYDCSGWLEKSASRSPDDAPELLATSSCSVLREIQQFMQEEQHEGNSKMGKPGKKAKSITDGFRASLRALMTKISNADPHYVRCVKPNMEKVPGRIVGSAVLEQLVLSGVLSAVRIRQQGFAVRLPLRRFVSTYQCLLPQVRRLTLSTEASAAELKAEVESIFSYMATLMPVIRDGKMHGWAVGESKVFMRAATSAAFEDARRQALAHLAALIQACFLSHQARLKLIPKKNLRDEMRAFLKRTDLGVVVQIADKQEDKSRRPSRRPSMVGRNALARLGSLAAGQEALAELDGFLQRATSLAFRNEEVLVCQRVHRLLQAEVEAATQLEALVGSLDSIEIEKAVARAVSLGFPRTGHLEALEVRGHRLKTQQPIVHAMKAAVSDHQEAVAAVAGTSNSALSVAESVDKLEEIAEVVGEVGLERGSEKWLPELGGAKLFEKLLQTLEEARQEEERRVQAQEAARASSVRFQTSENAAGDLPPTPAGQGAEALDKELGKAKGRPSRQSSRSICILSPADELQLLTDLHRAAEAYDAEALESLLRRAEQMGLRDTADGVSARPEEAGKDGSSSDEEGSDVEGTVSIEAARKVLERLQSTDFLLRALEVANGLTAGSDPPVVELRRMENLSRQLRKMPGYEEQAAGANQTVQHGLVQRSSRYRRKSAFDSRDPAELNLAAEAFGDLTNFSHLKPIRSWRGHRKTQFFDDAKPEVAATGMLAHSKVCIAEALTRAPKGCDEEAYEAAALQNFRNVLVCTGDRPAQECQRLASRDAVVELARTDPSLVSEVYMQALKQMAGDLSPRTARLTMELLHCLLLQVPPPTEIAEFVRSFLRDAGPKLGCSQAAALAKACQALLDRPNKSEMERCEESGEVSESSEVALLACRAAEVSRRLGEVTDRLTAEVAQLTEQNRKQTAEIAQLTEESTQNAGKTQASEPHDAVASLAAKASGVLDRLGRAAELLAEKVPHLNAESPQQALASGTAVEAAASKASAIAERLGKAAEGLVEKVAQLTKEREALEAKVAHLAKEREELAPKASLNPDAAIVADLDPAPEQERAFCRELAGRALSWAAATAVAAEATTEASAARAALARVAPAANAQVVEVQRLAAQNSWQASEIRRLHVEITRLQDPPDFRHISHELAVSALQEAAKAALEDEAATVQRSEEASPVLRRRSREIAQHAVEQAKAAAAGGLREREVKEQPSYLGQVADKLSENERRELEDLRTLRVELEHTRLSDLERKELEELRSLRAKFESLQQAPSAELEDARRCSKFDLGQSAALLPAEQVAKMAEAAAEYVEWLTLSTLANCSGEADSSKEASEAEEVDLSGFLEEEAKQVNPPVEAGQLSPGGGSGSTPAQPGPLQAKGKGKAGPPPPPKGATKAGAPGPSQADAPVDSGNAESPSSAEEAKASSKGKGKSKVGLPPPPKRLASKDMQPSGMSGPEAESPPPQPAAAVKGKGKDKGPGPPPPKQADLPKAIGEVPVSNGVEAAPKGKGKGKGPGPPPPKRADSSKALGTLPAADTLEPLVAKAKSKGKGESLATPLATPSDPSEIRGAQPAEGLAAEGKVPAEAIQRIRADWDGALCICVLGSTAFQGADSEALVVAVAAELAAALGNQAAFVTGGMPGVQRTFALHCGDGSRVWNLLPIGSSSGYSVGKDLHAGADLEARRRFFGLLGDVYLSIEGGPGVAQEALAAVERGAIVVPLARTGGASSGMFGFPPKALERPAFASEEQWESLRRGDAPVAEAAAAVVAIVASLARRRACSADAIAGPTPVEEAPAASRRLSSARQGSTSQEASDVQHAPLVPKGLGLDECSVAPAAAGPRTSTGRIDAPPPQAPMPADAVEAKLSSAGERRPSTSKQTGAPKARSSQLLGLDEATEAVASLKAEFRDSLCVCILGGVDFKGADSEALVTALAAELAATLGDRAAFVTGGMPGVQRAFARTCGDGSRVWNLLPVGESSGYGVGKDIHAGSDLEARKRIFSMLGDVYISVEGGPGVAKEARGAVERGAVVVPLARTGGASAGMFDFPASALERPAFASERQWESLRRSDVPVAEAAAAVAAIVATLAEQRASSLSAVFDRSGFAASFGSASAGLAMPAEASSASIAARWRSAAAQIKMAQSVVRSFSSGSRSSAEAALGSQAVAEVVDAECKAPDSHEAAANEMLLAHPAAVDTVKAAEVAHQQALDPHKVAANELLPAHTVAMDTPKAEVAKTSDTHQQDVAVNGAQPGASGDAVHLHTEARPVAVAARGDSTSPISRQSQEMLVQDVPGQVQAEQTANGHAEQQAKEKAVRRSRTESARRSQLEVAQRAREEAEKRAREEAEKAKKESSGWFSNWWGSAPSPKATPKAQAASPPAKLQPRMSLEQWLNEPASPASSEANGKR